MRLGSPLLVLLNLDLTQDVLPFGRPPSHYRHAHYTR